MTLSNKTDPNYSLLQTSGKQEAIIKVAKKRNFTIKQKRITALRENGNFFRNRLREMGFRIIGSEDSPVIPLMLFHPAKIAGFSRAALEEALAVVVVGFPATSLLGSRARFCVSAGHTREQLERALESISRIGDRLMLKYDQVEKAKAQ
jgi:serine palmitoyltransferase